MCFQETTLCFVRATGENCSFPREVSAPGVQKPSWFQSSLLGMQHPCPQSLQRSFCVTSAPLILTPDCSSVPRDSSDFTHPGTVVLPPPRVTDFQQFSFCIYTESQVFIVVHISLFNNYQHLFLSASSHPLSVRHIVPQMHQMFFTL